MIIFKVLIFFMLWILSVIFLFNSYFILSIFFSIMAIAQVIFFEFERGM